MSDPERTVVTTAASSNNVSGTCNVQLCSSAQELSSTDARLCNFPDLTDFVNQRTENDLDELFANRYTMANKLYVEVANGFPDPVIVCPWSKRPKRNFDYIGDQRKSWRGESRQNVGSEWRSNKGNPNYDSYVSQESRKRRNPAMDRVRVFYPGRTNP
ncbi:mRNA cap methylation RNMT-activating mini family protein [Acanthocheilonema viteae]|uniref:Uncharacterized protein n=1 Tax=Acanthocheilonema viteae TaxID=6277 RepID=A0A498SGS4_ACAVI|nr:unnamed protein product [Acanthocheilonema viteae]